MKTISDIRKELDTKSISSVELTKEYLKRIKDSSLGAYNTINEEGALNSAKLADEKSLLRSDDGRPEFFSYEGEI